MQLMMAKCLGLVRSTMAGSMPSVTAAPAGLVAVAVVDLVKSPCCAYLRR